MCILIVDDSQAMRFIVRKVLRQAGYDGYAIAEASNGEEALARIRRADCELILCDLNMPRMGGFELLESLSDRDRKVPFGIVTAETMHQIHDRAIAAGARFLIHKPFTAETLRDVLQYILPVR